MATILINDEPLEVEGGTPLFEIEKFVEIYKSKSSGGAKPIIIITREGDSFEVNPEDKDFTIENGDSIFITDERPTFGRMNVK